MNSPVSQTELSEQIEELADRLEFTYSDTLSSAVVDEVVSDCYEPMRNAKIKSYVAVLVEHNSRRRLRQLSPLRRTPATPPRATHGRWGSRVAGWVRSRRRGSTLTSQ